jgi:glycyl-tRNA synthetase
MKWHRAIGLDERQLRFHDHLKPAHYANAACDIEFEYPFGIKELEGIHSRTDFDLNKHQEFSGKKLQYFDPEIDKSYTPCVVETAIGLDRMFLALMCANLKEEMVDEEKGTTRIVLTLPPVLAPIKIAVLPLVKKDGLPEAALEIFNKLKLEFNVQYDEKDSIGKRYRRQDAIGTPYCITVDHQTLEDQTVTIRERDSMEQERIPVDRVMEIARERVSWSTVF